MPAQWSDIQRGLEQLRDTKKGISSGFFGPIREGIGKLVDRKERKDTREDTQQHEKDIVTLKTDEELRGEIDRLKAIYGDDEIQGYLQEAIDMPLEADARYSGQKFTYEVNETLRGELDRLKEMYGDDEVIALIKTSLQIPTDIEVAAQSDLYTKKGEIDKMLEETRGFENRKTLTHGTNEDIRSKEEMPLWKQLDYPDWETWHQDNMDKPDWQRLGFKNFEDWEQYELALRSAGKTDISMGDEQNARYQSYLAQLIGNNEDIFYTKDELGERVLRPWADMNENNRARVLELWGNLIQFETADVQATLMGMLETQLGTPLGGDTDTLDALSQLERTLDDFIKSQTPSGVTESHAILPPQPQPTPITAGVPGEAENEIVVGGEMDLADSEQRLTAALSELLTLYDLSSGTEREIKDDISELEEEGVLDIERMQEIAEWLELIPRIYYDRKTKPEFSLEY